jgi:hypothetical protein
MRSITALAISASMASISSTPCIRQFEAPMSATTSTNSVKQQRDVARAQRRHMAAAKKREAARQRAAQQEARDETVAPRAQRMPVLYQLAERRLHPPHGKPLILATPLQSGWVILFATWY